MGNQETTPKRPYVAPILRTASNRGATVLLACSALGEVDCGLYGGASGCCAANPDECATSC